MNESYATGKERCPQCAERGKDTMGDNLAVFSDGHAYCFACGYYRIGDRIRSFLIRADRDQSTLLKHEVFLPEDCSISYPKRTLEWMEGYEIDKHDMMRHRVLWSESKQRLIFPIFNDEQLIAHWGRYFGSDSLPKWKGYGSVKTFFHFLGEPSYKKVVLCEDIISGIKLAKVKGITSLTLFGTHIGAERYKRLHKLLPKDGHVIIWLDPDMYIHSTKQTMLGIQYGINVRNVLTEKDPKEHTLTEIEEYLK